MDKLKADVQAAQLAVAERDALEARFASLAAVASRLPVLRAQHVVLQDSCSEVEKLESTVSELQQVAGRGEERGPAHGRYK